MEIHGELYLHGALHLGLSVLENLAHEFWQGEHIMLQHPCKGQYLPVLPLIETLVDTLVIGVVGGAYPLHGPMLLGIPQRNTYQIEPIIHLQGNGVGIAGCPQSQEMRLRVAQGYLHLAGLKYLMRMGRTYPQAYPSIHNVFSQSHSQ